MLIMSLCLQGISLQSQSQIQIQDFHKQKEKCVHLDLIHLNFPYLCENVLPTQILSHFIYRSELPFILTTNSLGCLCPAMYLQLSFRLRYIPYLARCLNLIHRGLNLLEGVLLKVKCC